MKTTTTKYENPPLVELVCEFRFNLEESMDATIPGILYAEVKDKFPKKKQRNIGTMVQTEESGQAEMLVTQLAQFYNEDETLLIQVGHNMLTVNCLKKYPYWENFKPVVMDVFEKYLAIAKPKVIQKAAIRSINKINIDKVTQSELTNYFIFYPTIPKNVETSLSHANIHIETKINDRDILALKNTSGVSETDDKLSFVLDLQYLMNNPGELQINEIAEWLEAAHISLYQAFDNSITTKLKETFKPIK